MKYFLNLQKSESETILSRKIPKMATEEEGASPSPFLATLGTFPKTGIPDLFPGQHSMELEFKICPTFNNSHLRGPGFPKKVQIIHRVFWTYSLYCTIFVLLAQYMNCFTKSCTFWTKASCLSPRN